MTDSNPPPTAIVGAGLAGLSAALALTARGVSVAVFDKGRAPGGRLSTRRADGWSFDHGGQYLTVRDAGLRQVMDGLVADGHAARWDAHVVRLTPAGGVEPHRVERFVGVPGMNGIIRGLIARLPDAARPRFNHRVAAITGRRGAWHLRMEGGTEGPFAAIIIAIPAPQAVDLLSPVAPPLAALASESVMAPCWALMLGFDQDVPLPAWDAAFIAGAGGEGRPLSWIAHDGGKPGRDGGASFVAHAAADWSIRHLEDAAEAVASALLPAFRAVTGISGDPVMASAHRWRYALPTRPLPDGFLWDGALGIGACGDWCLEARAEAAFVSGAMLAAAMGEA